jgi:hypothetical protein
MMNRVEWIVKEICKDGKKNFKWILKGVALTMIMIALIKVLIAFDMRDWFLPIMAIMVPVGMLYHWYSMSYDLEKKKLVDKLKEGK